MSFTSRIPDARPETATLGWALRRAAFGFLVLSVMVIVGAWLFWASIDPDEAAAAGNANTGEYSTPQR